MKKYVKPTLEIAQFELCDSILTLSAVGPGSSTDIGGDLVFPDPKPNQKGLGNEPLVF